MPIQHQLSKSRSVIREQVEMGVAVRMACLDLLTRNLPNSELKNL